MEQTAAEASWQEQEQAEANKKTYYC